VLIRERKDESVLVVVDRAPAEYTAFGAWMVGLEETPDVDVNEGAGLAPAERALNALATAALGQRDHELSSKGRPRRRTRADWLQSGGPGFHVEADERQDLLPTSDDLPAVAKCVYWLAPDWNSEAMRWPVSACGRAIVHLHSRAEAEKEPERVLEMAPSMTAAFAAHNLQVREATAGAGRPEREKQATGEAAQAAQAAHAMGKAKEAVRAAATLASTAMAKVMPSPAPFALPSYCPTLLWSLLVNEKKMEPSHTFRLGPGSGEARALQRRLVVSTTTDPSIFNLDALQTGVPAEIPFERRLPCRVVVLPVPVQPPARLVIQRERRVLNNIRFPTFKEVRVHLRRPLHRSTAVVIRGRPVSVSRPSEDLELGARWAGSVAVAPVRDLSSSIAVQ
jgi:hypothetical protein